MGVASAAWSAWVWGKMGGRSVAALGRWAPALGHVWRACMGLRNVPPTGLVRTTRGARLRKLRVWKLRRALPHGRRASSTGLWVSLPCAGRS